MRMEEGVTNLFCAACLYVLQAESELGNRPKSNAFISGWSFSEEYRRWNYCQIAQACPCIEVCLRGALDATIRGFIKKGQTAHAFEWTQKTVIY